LILNTQHDQHQLTNFGQQVRLLLKLHLIWSVDSEENHGKGCHQRSDFMAKMHQIRYRLGLHPRPRWGAHSALPDLLAGFKGPTSEGEEGRGREGKGEERTEEEGKGTPLSKCLRTGLILRNSNMIVVPGP